MEAYGSYILQALTKVCIFLKSLSLLSDISRKYTTLLPNHIGPTFKQLPLFVLVPSREI